MTSYTQRLAQLLPAVYRIRDTEHRHVLEALLGVLGEQADVLERDLDQLYDNWFIETCDEWVVPYIGDLLGVRALPSAGGTVASQRAFVANVLAYRRGKGTAATLEQLARDLTGWPARAVEYFELLSWFQHVNHPRPHALATVDLRGEPGLVGGPFETAAHTVDVRHVDTGRGRYNVPNVGLNLWRLAAYPLERSPARPVGPGLFRFAQTGADAPLFTTPLTETGISQRADEVNVPGPIRLAALRADLAGFRAEHVAGGDVPASSDFYGPDRSVEVIRDGVGVAPLDVVAADLSAWDRPPPGVLGLRSGPVAPVSSATPQLAVTIGGEGRRVVPLGSAPSTVDDARTVLEAAIRAASRSAAFAGTRVHVVGGRLLVLPGVRGAAVSVTTTSADATTAGQLGLTGTAQSVHGVLSGELPDPPPLPAGPQEVRVTVSGAGSALAALAAPPATLAQAATVLGDAIRAADPDPAFSAAQVQVVAGRLLVLAGTGAPLTITPTGDDPITARLWQLSPAVAVDPVLGRLAFGLGDEPAGPVLVSYAYGGAADIGGGPYDRRDSLVTATDWSVRVSQQDATAEFDTIAGALAAWASPAGGNRGDGVITVADNGSYEEALAFAPADGHTLVVQAAAGHRPRIRPLDGEILLDGGGGPDAVVILDGLLVEGAVRALPGVIAALTVRHCTLVPGRSLTAEGGPAFPGLPSVTIGEPADASSLEISRCVTGPVRTPPDMSRLSVTDSIVDSPAGESEPALVSGSLSSFPPITATQPRVAVRLGTDPDRVALLPGVPGSLAQARDLLAVALRAAHPRLAQTRVLSAGDRLIVLSGTGDRLTIGEVPGDATASDLRLTTGMPTVAFLSRPLSPFPTLTAATPRVGLSMGEDPPVVATFAAVPVSLAQARDQLQQAIRAAAPGAAFTGCLVVAVDDRLVVVPGAAHTSVRFGGGDTTTVEELGLAGSVPAIAGTGGEFGAPAQIVTSTVFGEVRVRELTLASESVLTGTVIAQRRQTGCVRFSFVPVDSVVPRRFECQPATPGEAARVRPTFTSTRFGQPGYGQLGDACPPEITGGAADEDEMGALHLIRQRRRVTNLRVSLDEYLRLGLEAGVFFAT